MEEQEERERERQTEDRTDSFCERKNVFVTLRYSVVSKINIRLKRKRYCIMIKLPSISYSTYGSCGFYVNK